MAACRRRHLCYPPSRRCISVDVGEVVSLEEVLLQCEFSSVFSVASEEEGELPIGVQHRGLVVNR